MDNFIFLSAEERPRHDAGTPARITGSHAPWIEIEYNRRRREQGLGRLTPVELGMIDTASTAA